MTFYQYVSELFDVLLDPKFQTMFMTFCTQYVQMCCMCHHCKSIFFTFFAVGRA